MRDYKVSIVMSYHNRAKLLRNTLESYEFHYSGILEKIELCIVDDSSDEPGELLSLLKDFKLSFKTKYIDRKDKKVRNPCAPYNIAASMSSGEIIHLTNPENCHMEPIIRDAIDRFTPDQYLVYACINLKDLPNSYEDLSENLSGMINENLPWYQHSAFNNRLLHFCTFISKYKFDEIGGFDNIYSDGSGYDDNDLIQSVVSSGLKVVNVDELYCAHQPHSRNWDHESTIKNFQLICDKWGFPPVSLWRSGQEKDQMTKASQEHTKTFIFRT